MAAVLEQSRRWATSRIPSFRTTSGARLAKLSQRQPGLTSNRPQRALRNVLARPTAERYVPSLSSHDSFIVPVASVLPDLRESVLPEDALYFAKLHGTSLLSLLPRMLCGTDGTGRALSVSVVEVIVHNCSSWTRAALTCHSPGELRQSCHRASTDRCSGSFPRLA